LSDVNGDVSEVPDDLKEHCLGLVESIVKQWKWFRDEGVMDSESFRRRDAQQLIQELRKQLDATKTATATGQGVA
jgi:hypothetical protein